jgi:Spy/CpxP family protein refolding chaperone
MKARFYKNLVVSLVALFMLLIHEPGFCQQNPKTDQKNQAKSQSITAEQTQQIKKILSGHNASKLSAADAKAIQEKFREAEIHAGPETASAIIAAGFDPEKLRSLAPPPDAVNKPKSGPPSIDERLKRVDEQICKPLSLSSSQKETVDKAFWEFFNEMDKLPKPQANAMTPPDKSKVEPLEKTRDAKIKQVLSADQFKKYQELEKASRPNKQGSKDQKPNQTESATPKAK